MPLDPNIALQVRGLEVPNPMNQLAQVTQIQNALQQQRMGQISMENALREQRREQDVENIMKGFQVGTPVDKQVAALQAGGHFKAAQALQMTHLQQEKERRLAQEAELKAESARYGLLGQILSGVNSQASLNAALPQIAKLPGVEPADLQQLQTYNPEVIDQLRNRALSVYQQGSLANQAATAQAATQRAAAADVAAQAARMRAGQEQVPADIRTFRAVQAMPEQEREAFTAFQAAKRPQTTVTVDQRGEQAESVARGQSLVKHETTVREAAVAARKSLAGIQSAQDVLAKGFDTGFGTETKAKGAAVLAALGVKGAEAYATNAEKFLQASMNQVLATQLEQKGVQTNQDAQRIEQIGARMGATKATNEFILDVARAQADRAIAQDKFYRDWMRDPANKKSLAGAEDAWLEGEGGKSIFESPRLQKYGVLASERAQTSPAPAGPVVGGRSATPRGQTPTAAPPAAAIDALLKGQGTDEQFDEIFGRGAAAAARAGRK